MSIDEGTAPKMRPLCMVCGDAFSPLRRKAGYSLCLTCGDDAAKAERAGWCVVQEYGKGPYQLVTQSAAARTLRETNQKQPR